MVDCIRHKSVNEIMAVDLMPPQYLTTFGPIIDGIVVPSEPKQIMESGISDFNYYFHHNFTPPNTLFNSNSVHYFNNYDLLFGVTRVESPYIFSAHEERHGIDSLKRDRILRTLVRNLFDFHQQVSQSVTHSIVHKIFNDFHEITICGSQKRNFKQMKHRCTLVIVVK